ncbi:MAG: protein jag [Lachnospiraceae bacterium]|nr:protein jag [Lachnospiraceae bacterium]
MAKSVEKSAKTVEEAKQAALAELGIREEEAEIEVLVEASKGFFGLIGGHDAKVRVTAKESPAEQKKAENDEMPMPEVIETSRQVGDLAKKKAQEERSERPRFREMISEEEASVPLEKAEAFLQQIFASMHLTVNIEREKSDEAFVLNMSGDDLGILIGKHGQTLDSLQYLTNLAANHEMAEKRVRIVLDVEHYRNRREETLRRLASRLADKALRTRQRIMLEPMNRHERKIIHMALQENRRVSTYSAGDEPYRKVVIEPVRGRGGYRDRRSAGTDRRPNYAQYVEGDGLGDRQSAEE